MGLAARERSCGLPSQSQLGYVGGIQILGQAGIETMGEAPRVDAILVKTVR